MISVKDGQYFLRLSHPSRHQNNSKIFLPLLDEIKYFNYNL